MLVLATALVGVLVGPSPWRSPLPADQRTFTRVVPLVQLIISVLTPFSAALLTHDLRDPQPARCGAGGSPPRSTGWWPAATAPRWSAAAVAVGSGGQLSTIDPWIGAWSAAFGSLVAQLIPVGVGCGAGLLIRRAGYAELATIAVPLAASFLLGRYSPAGTTEWVTPLGAVSHLLPGPMTPVAWAQWAVTATLWVVLPNAIGARLLRRRRGATNG